MNYRFLRDGEKLRRGDEYWSTMGYKETNMVGTRVGEHYLKVPSSVLKYRRPKSGNKTIKHHLLKSVDMVKPCGDCSAGDLS